MLSAPTPTTTAVPTGGCGCPHCSTSWEEDVAEASAWLDAGSRFEGLCTCGSYLVWEQRPRGVWTLASWLPPVTSVAT